VFFKKKRIPLNFESQQIGDIILVSSRGYRPLLNKLGQGIGAFAYAKYSHVIIALDVGTFIEAIHTHTDKNERIGSRLLSYKELNKKYSNNDFNRIKVIRRKGANNLHQSLFEGALFNYGAEYDQAFLKNHKNTEKDKTYCSYLGYRILLNAGINVLSDIRKLVCFKRVVWPVHYQYLPEKLWTDVTDKYVEKERSNHAFTDEFYEKMFQSNFKQFEDNLNHQTYLNDLIREELTNLTKAAMDLEKMRAEKEARIDAEFEFPTFFENFCEPLKHAVSDYQSTEKANNDIERTSHILTSSYKQTNAKIKLIVLHHRLIRHLERPRNAVLDSMTEEDFEFSKKFLESEQQGLPDIFSAYFKSIQKLLNTYWILYLRSIITKNKEVVD